MGPRGGSRGPTLAGRPDHRRERGRYLPGGPSVYKPTLRRGWGSASRRAMTCLRGFKCLLLTSGGCDWRSSAVVLFIIRQSGWVALRQHGVGMSLEKQDGEVFATTCGFSKSTTTRQSTPALRETPTKLINSGNKELSPHGKGD